MLFQYLSQDAPPGLQTGQERWETASEHWAWSYRPGVLKMPVRNPREPRRFLQDHLPGWELEVETAYDEAQLFGILRVQLPAQGFADEATLAPLVRGVMGAMARTKGAPHPSLIFDLPHRADAAEVVRDLRYLWDRLWARAGSTAKPALVIVPVNVSPQTPVRVAAPLRRWAGDVIGLLFHVPVVTSDVLALLSAQGSLDDPTYLWSNRVTALRRVGLLHGSPTPVSADLKGWHEEMTGIETGRRPIQFYSSLLYRVHD